MGWFKDLLGTSNWQTAAPTPTVASGPLGMAQGKAVRFDTTLALLLDGSTTVRVPFDQAIWSARLGRPRPVQQTAPLLHERRGFLATDPRHR